MEGVVLEDKPVVDILWTGGWDSTFRIICLAQREVLVQPYYLISNRQSSENEMVAISKIKKELLRLDITKCSFMPMRILDIKDIEADDKITNSYERLKSKIGDQYNWLARFAKAHKGIELCIHKDDKAAGVINDLGEIRYRKNGSIGEYYVVDRANSSDDIGNLFGNFHFPLLKTSKLEMRSTAKDMGCLDIMNLTWFCHNPDNNNPCGLCNPCIYTIREGMAFRLPKKALWRYRWRYSGIRKFLSRIKWMILRPSWNK